MAGIGFELKKLTADTSPKSLPQIALYKTLIISALIAVIFLNSAYIFACLLLGFVFYFRKSWEIALSGIFYFLAIYLIKAELMPMLTAIPGLLFFMVYQEAVFFKRYVKYYRAIQGNATLRMIEKNSLSLIRLITDQVRSLFIFQGCICVSALLINQFQNELFLFGALGVYFHVMLLFMVIRLAYFDWGKGILLIQAMFLVITLCASYFSMKMDGSGYFLSTVTTFAFATFLAKRYFKDLPYHVFVK